MSSTIKKLAYVHLNSKNPQETALFFEDLFDWETTEGENGQIYVAVDKYHHRITIYQNDEPGLRAAGWQVLNKRDFLKTQKVLDEAGVSYHVGTEAECEERKVREFISFIDPSGNTAEVCYAPYVTRPNCQSIGSLDILDLLHVTLSVTAAEFKANLQFYEEVLEFNVSDLFNKRIAFTRCSQNHHNLAMVTSEEPGRRFRHFMFEVRTFDDVMKTLMKAKKLNIPVEGPSKHGNCQTVHVYMPIPGMGKGLIEIGWNHKKILDDENWEVVCYDFEGEKLAEFIDVWKAPEVQKEKISSK